MVEKDIPEPRGAQVRIKIQACDICHGDSVTKDGLKLTMPVLAVRGSYYLVLGGNVTNCTVSSCTLYALSLKFIVSIGITTENRIISEVHINPSDKRTFP
jgi:hypothetical protein